ncbi:MAG TPA: class I SAM-dependent methyltransferase, partial [Polyangiaceae bacterium]|nr:class I SAM-dependent methyltransferase [Polyangiaceae bacterium]
QTDFHQDLSAVEESLREVTNSAPWLLGAPLPEGQEWLGVTFQNQRAAPWSESEFLKFREDMTKTAREAYERMASAAPEQHHGWANPNHAEKEVDLLIRELNLTPGQSVLDFGCGSGRHSICLARRGFHVVGIDSSASAIAAARARAKREGSGARFVAADCLTWRPEKQFDAAICLYDVVGSYPDDDLNQRLLEALIASVRPNGPLALSVMSFDYINQIAKLRCAGRPYAKFAALPASDTMQASGNVFNPRFCLVDTTTRVVYRKEQFTIGHAPTELIVPDRRYGLSEIAKMCKRAGIEVASARFVKAGSFRATENAKPTKEILVVGRKGRLF